MEIHLSCARATSWMAALRRAAGVAAASGAAGVAGGYFWARQTMGEDALARILKFDKVAVPAIIEYKWVEAKCEKLPRILPMIFPPVSDEEELAQFLVLHKKWAQPIFDVFMELGGFYYKSGQKIAANTAGVVPKYYVDMFQPFLDRIPPRPPFEIRSVVEAELGRPLQDVFSFFDEKPIGCASIGQTHRAVLRATGERVVVKVQNPEAERTFRGDVFALKVIVDLFAPQVSPSFDEIQKQFATEFDYRGECANAITVRNNLLRSGRFPNVLVPRVYEALSSKRLMVMEEIYPCIPLHQALDAQAEIIAKQRGITKEEFIRTEKARIDEEARNAAAKGRLVRQLSSRTYDRYISVQKARRSWKRGYRCLYNWTIGIATLGFSQYNLDEEDTLVPINAAKLVDELLAVTGHEVLIDGCFNADPHPGNILYVDSVWPPKLGLIDYGQVKKLTNEQRYKLAKAILLVKAALEVDPRTDPSIEPIVHERAKESVVRHMFNEMGVITKFLDSDVVYQQATVFFGRMDAAWLYPLNVLQWSDKMEAKDPLVDISACDFLVMLHLTTMMIRGLGEMMQQSRNLAEVWSPMAREALSEKPGMLEELQAEVRSWKEPQC